MSRGFTSYTNSAKDALFTNRHKKYTFLYVGISNLRRVPIPYIKTILELFLDAQHLGHSSVPILQQNTIRIFRTGIFFLNLQLYILVGPFSFHTLPNCSL